MSISSAIECIASVQMQRTNASPRLSFLNINTAIPTNMKVLFYRCHEAGGRPVGGCVACSGSREGDPWVRTAHDQVTLHSLRVVTQLAAASG